MAGTFPGRAVPIVKFVREQPEIPWLVERLLPAVGWTLLVGAKGVGKTTLAVQLCVALQEGTPFLGRETKQTNVLFVQVDSPEIEWRAILARIAPNSRGYTMVTVPNFALDSAEYTARMAHLIEQVDPGFIVFDSLYRMSRRGVNTEKVLETMDTLTLLSASVPWLLIHHPPHDESRAAGHNSIGATCSNEWHLLKTKLVLDKGRLVADKEILLQRAGEDEGGIWKVREQAKVTPGKSIIAQRLV